MNKIYKVVKSRAFGILTAVSELAKGAKKSSVGQLFSLLFLSTFSASALAAISIGPGFNPAENDNKVGSIVVSGANQQIDLGIGGGFGDVEKGHDVNKHTIRTSDSISSLYKIKYQDVAEAQNNLNDALNSGVDESVIEQLTQILNDKQNAAAQISDQKLKINDPDNLIGKNTEATRISEVKTKYKDPISGKVFEIKVKDNLVKTQAGSQVSGGSMTIEFYEKMPISSQYNDLQIIEVNGTDTDVTITNTGDQSNTQLSAISKNASGVIKVNDGANLTFDSDVSYYTGGSDSKSQAFKDKEEYSSSSHQALYEVAFKGNVNTILGTKSITNEKEFNKFNRELIKFIQTDEQIRLTYSTPEAMQAFYEQQISGLYTSKILGSFDISYTLTQEELAEQAKQQGLEDAFNNRVTEADKGSDIGLASASENYLVGVTGSGSVINVTENANINSFVKDENGKFLISSGTVIKADFEDSGLTENNIFNIDGKIEARGYGSTSGSAIVAKNAEIYISETGSIKGDISIKGPGANNGADQNIIENKGYIKGNIKIDTGMVNNHANIDGDIAAGANSTIINQDGSTISGDVIAGNNSTITNNDNAKIDGVVTVQGSDSVFVNNGYAGGTHAKHGASIENNFIMLSNVSSSGDGTIKLENQSKLINSGDIYIGYVNDNGVMKVGAARNKYSAISIRDQGSLLANKKNIHVAGNQSDVNVIYVTGGGTYIDTADSTIKINQENNDITGVDKERGNDNRVINVKGSDAKATINGLIELNDIGSTALWGEQGAEITLNGRIHLNGQNIKDANDPSNPEKETGVRSFGAWVMGENAKFIMSGNAEINMNADRAIGVHIRDGATAEINDHSGITFSDKKNQIGFLISGISQASSINYNSDQQLKLNGEGAVLFRVERGSIFNNETLSGSQDLSVLDSNGTKNSTLLVLTNGAVKEGASNKTTANLDGFTFNVNGENAKGMSIEGGAQATITDSTAIKLTGENSILAKVDGWYYDINGEHNSKQDGQSLLMSSAHLTSSVVTGQNSVGYYLTNGGKLLHAGTINFEQPSRNNIGVKIDSGGNLVSESGSSIKVNGTAVEISGNTSQATVDNVGNGDEPVIWAIGSTNDNSAYHVKDQANLTLIGSGLTKAEGTAHGILVDGAAQITLDGARIDLYGGGSGSSTGNGIENRSALTNIQLKNNATIDIKDGIGIHSSVGFKQNAQTSGVINIYGNGTGISFENIDPITGIGGGITDNVINNTGYENVVINVLKQSGQGIYVNSSKDVTTSASVNIISQQGKSALIIDGTTEKATQSGYLHSANKGSAIVDLNNGNMNSFTNNGDLLFGDFADDADGNHVFTAGDKATISNSYAVKTGSNENALHFTNDTKGKINGIVELSGYGDKTDPTDKTKGNIVELKGEGHIFRTGEGNDEFIVRTVVGDDSGGENQVKQFTQLDGGMGDDKITFETGSDFTITKDSTIKNIEYVALNGNSNVVLDNLNSVDGLNTGTTTYDIKDTGSKLTYIRNQHAQNFNRELAGNGVFKVDLQDTAHQFSFDDSHNIGNFNGTLELVNANFNLVDSTNNKNTTALTNATLKASDNGVIVVGNQELDRTHAAIDDEQHIKGLEFNGGTVDFGRVDIKQDNDKSLHHISVTDLALNGGYVQVSVGDEILAPTYSNLNGVMGISLLEQDDGVTTCGTGDEKCIFTQLVSSENQVTGSVGNVSLVDSEGNAVEHILTKNITQGSDSQAARATYNTKLLDEKDGQYGLYLGYGLTQIELKAQNNNALVLEAEAGKTGNATDLNAKLTDFVNDDNSLSYGDIRIKSQTDNAVTLSNNNNDYHGATYVLSESHLKSGTDHALGNTKLLYLSEGTEDHKTSYDLNGQNQAMGSLVTKVNSMVDLNGGTLTLTGIDGTDPAAELGSFTAENTLTGAGQLTIGDTSLTRDADQHAILNISGNNTGLTANIDIAANGQINQNALGGLGSGTLTNSGTLNLNLANNGSLTNTLVTGNGTLNKFNTGTLTLTLDQAKTYTGVTNINGGAIVFKGDENATTDSYATQTINIANNGALIGLDNVILTGQVNNAGRFYVGNLGDSSDVNEHTVTVGSYVGSGNSNIIFNGQLSDDSSPINKLIVTGDTSGTSYVTVNNIGGLGAQTIDGIEIIQVDGQSEAEFIKAKRIIAGAYDYALVRSDSNNNNWVLKSTELLRPEVGGYLGNIFAANNMFNLRLHDRLGETQYTDLITGERKTTSMWLRYQYGYNKFRAGNGELDIKNNWNITQLGGDIAQWSSNNLNRLHIGLMAGKGRSNNSASSTLSHLKSDSTIDGYNYGLYATWYNNDQDKTGLYLDSWASWSTFKGSVSGEDTSQKYRLKGLTASVESGYSFLSGELGNYDVWLQPKAQLIWSDVKAKDYVEDNQTKVSSNHGNLQTRLGLRASLLSKPVVMRKTGQAGQIFVEANWLYNSKLYEVTVNDEMSIEQDGARHIGELKFGMEGNIRKNTSLWFNLGGQWGEHNYSNASVIIGAKYSF